MSRYNLLKRLYDQLPHQGGRAIELDFVRGVAILMVMVYHYSGLRSENHIYSKVLGFPGRIGFAGVDVFFVLSGFLVGGLLIKEYKSTGSLEVRLFILRRGLKIWPMYYVFILIEAATVHHPLRTFLWQNLLHIQNFAGSSITHTWTLSLEEHFYLALALGMGWMVSRKWKPSRMLKLFLAVLVLVLALRTVACYGFRLLNVFQQTQFRIDELACGVILGLLYYFYPERFRQFSRYPIALTVIFALSLLFLDTVDDPYILDSIGYTITYIGAASFFLLVFSHSGRIRGWVPYRIVAAIGVYSYGIYLYHIAVTTPLTAITRLLLPALPWPVFIMLQMICAILVGAGISRIVEWPFLRYRDRIFPQRVKDIDSPPQNNFKPPDSEAGSKL